MIAMGAKWTVGDEQSIKVFEDKWLPGLSGGKIASVQLGLDGNLKVAALMSSDKACWNEQLVDSLFLPHEAQQIKAIPLCLVPQSDYLYWSAEKNGIYSVKSGYKLLCEEARTEDASGSSREEMAEPWTCGLGFGN